MSTEYVNTHEQKAKLTERILNTRGGLTVTVVKGKAKFKSYNQDRTENMWHREAAEQLGDETPEEKRGYSKLHFGIPIMRGENEAFRKDYDIMIRPLFYQMKIKMMMAPIDFPVTRKMKMGQKARYMEDIRAHYEGQGVILTIPNDDEDV